MKRTLRYLIRLFARLLSRLDPELTEPEYRIAELPWDDLHHGGVDNVCVSGNEAGERYVFRCGRCRHWTCDCKGSDGDLCDDCWCAVNVYGGEVRP